MTISSIIKSGDAVTPGASTGIACFIDCCSAGSVGNFYGPFTPGALVSDQLGGGPLADQILAYLSSGGQAAYAIPATVTWGSFPSVTHTGTGPTVTYGAAAGASGPFDSHTTTITILIGGPNGQAIMSIGYDGGPAAVETMPVPAATPGVLTGTAPITPTVLASANGLTLVFANPTAETLTFPAGSLVAAAAGLLAATATVASIVTLLPAGLLAAGLAALLANPRKLTFTTAGSPASDAPANVAITGTDYTGATITETLNLAQTAAEVTSVNVYATIVSLVYPAADGTGATVAVGYADAYATPAELIAEAQTLATAAPLAVTTGDAQTSLGHFLSFTTTSTGTGGHVSFNASPGTAAALFGFTASQTNTGAAGSYSPPWTGGTYSFPTGSYVAKDTYVTAAQGPTASTAAVVAAMAIGRTNWKQHPFGFFAVTSPPSSAANAAALQAACSSTVATYVADNSCPVACFTGTAFHTASAVPATNQANITTMDTATAAAFAGNPAALDLVAVDDCYFQGSTNLRPGSFRRSAVLAAAIQRAVLSKLGASIAEGIVPGCSLRAPDGLTLARDEKTAVVKLGPSTGGNTGPGFSVLKVTAGGVGAPKFSAGVTRAGTTSRLRTDNAVFVALFISQTLFARAETWEGQTWQTSPAATSTGPAGQITDQEATSHADDAYTDLQPYLEPPGKDPSVSQGWTVAIDNSGVFINTGAVPLSCQFIPLGVVFDVNITTTAIGVITSAAGTSISG